MQHLLRIRIEIVASSISSKRRVAHYLQLKSEMVARDPASHDGQNAMMNISGILNPVSSQIPCDINTSVEFLIIAARDRMRSGEANIIKPSRQVADVMSMKKID